MAVPGCPLPTFWTASIASTRTVSTAWSSTSVQSSRCGMLTWVLTAVGAGGSRPWPSLLIAGDRLDGAPVPEPRVPSTRPSQRGRPCPTSVSGPRDRPRRRWPRGGRASQGRGDGVRRAHQAAGHRAAPAHHRAGDVLRRGRGPAAGRWWSRRSSAAPSRRARRRRSTASTTATSTSRCGAPGAGRCRGTSSRPRGHRLRRRAGRAARRWSCWSGSTGSPRRSRCWPNAFYLLVYTIWLKRRTTQNIVWGGLAGCFPALIGWTAVTGELAWPPVVLFLVVFFWTPPHTWALALRYREDYAASTCRCCRWWPRPPGRPPDRPLHLGHGGHVAAAVAGGRHRLGVRRGRGRARRGVPRRGAPVCGARALGPARTSRRSSRCGSSTSRTSTSRCCSSRSRSTRCCAERARADSTTAVDRADTRRGAEQVQHDQRLGQVEEVLREADEPLRQLDSEQRPAAQATRGPRRGGRGPAARPSARAGGRPRRVQRGTSPAGRSRSGRRRCRPSAGRCR